MNDSTAAVKLMYNTKLGRFLFKIILKARVDNVIVGFLRTPYSKPIIKWYVKKYKITLEPFQINSFKTYRDFFVRARTNFKMDITPGHLISPCDGYLSYFPIENNASFCIKNSYYKIGDLIQNQELGAQYVDGDCLIFRLCAYDYHHYCYIDDGFQGKNHFISGQLHSVQPIACEKLPVYTLNRRSWSLMTTEHFGPVVQTEVGAFVVGGIVNDKENSRFRKGEEKGHFELCGSTIVLLFRKNKVSLLPHILNQLVGGEEIRVQQGQHIGNSYIESDSDV